MNREILEQEFPKELIKQRKGNFGKTLDYIEVASVIQRLNDAFDGLWSYEVVSHLIEENEVIVLGKLTAEGISKVQWGGSTLTKHQKTGAVLSLADDLKAAASDALKKCASHFGVALSIYGLDPLPSEPPTINKSNETLTQEQLSQIKELRTKLGWKPEKVMATSETLFQTEVMGLNPTMADAFIAYLKNQSNGKPTGDTPF